MREHNSNKCYNILKEDFGQSVSLETVQKAYTKFRIVFKNNNNIIYQNESFWGKDSHNNYSVDENCFFQMKIIIRYGN